jgi:hypothetical protein
MFVVPIENIDPIPNWTITCPFIKVSNSNFIAGFDYYKAWN